MIKDEAIAILEDARDRVRHGKWDRAKEAHAAICDVLAGQAVDAENDPETLYADRIYRLLSWDLGWVSHDAHLVYKAAAFLLGGVECDRV